MQLGNYLLGLFNLLIFVEACSEKFRISLVHVLCARLVGLVYLIFWAKRPENSSKVFQFRLLFFFLGDQAVTTLYLRYWLVRPLPLLLKVASDYLLTAIQSLYLEHLSGNLRLTLKTHLLCLLKLSANLLWFCHALRIFNLSFKRILILRLYCRSWHLFEF